MNVFVLVFLNANTKLQLSQSLLMRISFRSVMDLVGVVSGNESAILARAEPVW